MQYIIRVIQKYSLSSKLIKKANMIFLMLILLTPMFSNISVEAALGYTIIKEQAAPVGITFDSDDNMYIAKQGSIVKVSGDAKTTVWEEAYDYGIPLFGGVAIHNNEIYFSNQTGKKIYKLVGDQRQVVYDFTPEYDSLGSIRGIAFLNDVLYFSSSEGFNSTKNKIYKIENGIKSEYASLTNCEPYGIGFDSNKNLHVACMGQFKVISISPGGVQNLVADLSSISVGPGGVAFNSSGEMFITDYWGSYNPPANNAPTNIILSNNIVNQDAMNSSLVSNLSTTDLDSGDTHTYSLVPGIDSVDNEKFSIIGDQLFVNEPETLTPGNYYIRIQTSDGKDVYQKAFEIRVISNYLTNLSINKGTLSPTFNSETTSYTASVGNEVTDLDVIAMTSDTTATIKIKGTVVGSGDAHTVALNVGENPIDVEVTAQNGTKKTYMVTVTRAATSAQLRKDTITTVSSSINPSIEGQNVTFTAITTATPSSSGTLTGTVTFMDGASVLGTVELEPLGISNGKSKAVYSTSTLSVGSHTITAVYSGDSNFDIGTFEPIIQIVNRGSTGGGGTTPTPTPSPSPTPGDGSTTEIITVDVDGENGENLNKTPIQRTTETNGTVKDFVTMPDNIAKETVVKAKKSGNDTASIIIPDEKDMVSETKVEVPKTALAELKSGDLNLGIYTENATISIPKASLLDFNDDLYFRLVPIKKEDERKQVEERAKKEEVVKEALGDGTIEVVGRPMTIETNLTSRKVDLILPLLGVNLPENTKERKSFLNNLAIFIEHSDGDRVLVRPEPVEYKDGLQGLKFTIEKFSTFTIVKMDNLDEYFNGKIGHKLYIHGIGNGYFAPNANVTRSQMAAMLARNLDKAPTTNLPAYQDVSRKHWAYADIMEAKNAGIMLGISTTKFDPEGSVTRSQMAAIAYRWIQAECKSDSSAYESCGKLSNQTKAGYTDVPAKHWAADAINFLKDTEIMVGYDDGLFHPEDKLTRAQAVKVLNRLFKRGPLTGVSTSTFKDVPTTHWAYEEIEEAGREHQYKTEKDGTEILK